MDETLKNVYFKTQILKISLLQLVHSGQIGLSARLYKRICKYETHFGNEQASTNNGNYLLTGKLMKKQISMWSIH